MRGRAPPSRVAARCVTWANNLPSLVLSILVSKEPAGRWLKDAPEVPFHNRVGMYEKDSGVTDRLLALLGPGLVQVKSVGPGQT